jgi:hypothetical protein
MKILAKHSLTGVSNAKHQLIGSVAVGGVIKYDAVYYEGSYEVVPIAKDQELITKEKTMKENLQIKAIPYAEVTNNANGITITIGGN